MSTKIDLFCFWTHPRLMRPYIFTCGAEQHSQPPLFLSRDISVTKMSGKIFLILGYYIPGNYIIWHLKMDGWNTSFLYNMYIYIFTYSFKYLSIYVYIDLDINTFGWATFYSTATSQEGRGTNIFVDCSKPSNLQLWAGAVPGASWITGEPRDLAWWYWKPRCLRGYGALKSNLGSFLCRQRFYQQCQAAFLVSLVVSPLMESAEPLWCWKTEEVVWCWKTEEVVWCWKTEEVVDARVDKGAKGYA